LGNYSPNKSNGKLDKQLFELLFRENFTYFLLIKNSVRMKTKIYFPGLLMIIIVMFSISEITGFCGLGDQNPAKPFRVIVIIGDQWQDPMSYMVTSPEPLDKYSGYYGNPDVPGQIDFYHLMILLKSWAIPFDIVRLDQQFLDRNMFLGPDGKPKYGTIIWDVNQSDKLLHPDYSIIKEMVENYGIGLIALSNRISQPEIQSVLGIKYNGSWESSESMEVAGKHFLTDGLNSTLLIDDGVSGFMQRHQVETLKGTNTIIEQGGYPQSTCRVLESGTRVVWIGHDFNFMFIGTIRLYRKR